MEEKIFNSDNDSSINQKSEDIEEVQFVEEDKPTFVDNPPEPIMNQIFKGTSFGNIGSDKLQNPPEQHTRPDMKKLSLNSIHFEEQKPPLLHLGSFKLSYDGGNQTPKNVPLTPTKILSPNSLSRKEVEFKKARSKSSSSDESQKEKNINYNLDLDSPLIEEKEKKVKSLPQLEELPNKSKFSRSSSKTNQVDLPSNNQIKKDVPTIITLDDLKKMKNSKNSGFGGEKKKKNFKKFKNFEIFKRFDQEESKIWYEQYS